MTPVTALCGVLILTLMLGFGAGWRLRGAYEHEKTTEIHNTITKDHSSG